MDDPIEDVSQDECAGDVIWAMNELIDKVNLNGFIDKDDVLAALGKYGILNETPTPT